MEAGFIPLDVACLCEGIHRQSFTGVALDLVLGGGGYVVLARSGFGDISSAQPRRRGSLHAVGSRHGLLLLFIVLSLFMIIVIVCYCYYYCCYCHY